MSGPRGETSLMGWFYRFAPAEGSNAYRPSLISLQTSLWDIPRLYHKATARLCYERHHDPHHSQTGDPIVPRIRRCAEGADRIGRVKILATQTCVTRCNWRVLGSHEKLKNESEMQGLFT